MKERLTQWFDRCKKNFKFVEFVLSVVMFGWGALLISPLNTFASVKSYDSLAAAAPESVWGCVCLGIAAFLFHGMLHQNRILRCSGHLLAIGLWSNIATMVILSNPASTGWIIYYGVAVLHMFMCMVCWQSGKDVGRP